MPEITAGTVVIDAIAREAGSRTKMAVSSIDEKIDPVGSCVGQKGIRVQSIISELHGEKIDIVPHDKDISKFIASSLSPAKVTGVEVDHDEKDAKVSVPEDQLSLAIGKDGQNVRLAAKLTKWRIDIKGASGLFGDGVDFSGEGDKEEAIVGVWDAAITAAKKQESDEKDEADAEAAKEAKEKAEEETEVAEDVKEEDTTEATEVEEPAESEEPSDDEKKPEEK